MALVAARRRTVSRRVVPSEQMGTGVPGQIVIVDAAGADVTAITLGAGETFDLNAKVYDAGSPGLEIIGLTVTWVSSNPAVATVDSDGIVSRVANGTCTITASVSSAGGNPVADVAAVTTTGTTAVNTLVASESAFSGTAGATHQFTVQPKDASGNNLAGRTVTVDTDNHAFATAIVSGYTVTVTLIAAGTVIVTATCETKTAAVTGTVNAASAEMPNLPGGYTLFSRALCDVVPSTSYGTVSGWTGKHQMDGGTLNLATDGTAPIDSSTLRARFPSGLKNGLAPCKLDSWDPAGTESAPTQYSAIYFVMWFKIGTLAGFENQGVGTKFGFFSYGEAPSLSRNQLFLLWKGTGTAGVMTASKFSIEQQRTVTRSIPSSGSNTVTTGVWHQLELVLVMNSAAGVADGTAQMWFNGAQKINVSNVVYKTSGATRGFQWYSFNPTWGGVSVPDVFRTQNDDAWLTDYRLYGIAA